MKNQLFIFMLLLIFASCNKEESSQTTVSGVVKARNGEAIIPNARVYLIKQVIKRSRNQIVMDSTRADENGYYTFSFDYGPAPNPGGFRVKAEAPLYYSLDAKGGTAGEPQNYLQVGKTQTHNVELWPHAWLKMRFINQSGAYSVTTNSLFGTNSGFGLFLSQDETVTSICLGNADNRLVYFVTQQRLGPSIGNERTVFCQGHDTAHIEITY